MRKPEQIEVNRRSSDGFEVDDGIFVKSLSGEELKKMRTLEQLLETDREAGLAVVSQLMEESSENFLQGAVNGTLLDELRSTVEYEISQASEITDLDYRLRIRALELEYQTFTLLLSPSSWLHENDTAEMFWRRKSHFLEFAVPVAHRMGLLLNQCLVLRKSPHLRAGRATKEGGRKSAESTIRKHQLRLNLLAEVAEKEFLRLRKQDAYSNWSWSRLCKKVAELPPVITANDKRKPSGKTICRMLPHLK